MRYFRMGACALLVVCGCVPPNTAAQTQSTTQFAGQRHDAEVYACDHQMSATATPIENCKIEAEQRWLNTIDFPWMDLAYQNESERLAIAEAFDAGRLSKERALLELDASDARMTNQVQRRTAAYSAARAAQDAANSLAQLQQLQAAAQLLKPIAPQAPPTQTICQRLGEQVICNTQ